MKVAIVSDIHDNIWKLDAALEAVEAAEVLVCCGDLCSPFIIDRLAQGFSGPIHIVFGNNDADRFRMTLRARHYQHVHLHGEYFEETFGGKLFAVNHFDDIGRALAASGAFDVVCYGHNHAYEVRREGSTLVINPGEVMGGLSEGQVASCVIYDSETHSAERLLLESKA